MRSLAGLVLILALLPTPLVGQEYLVVDGTGGESGWSRAGQLLARYRQGGVIPFDPADPAPLKRRLIAIQPRAVVVLVRPDQLEFGLVRRILQMATELDTDPFIDCDLAYLTGATPAEATAFVRAILVRAVAGPRMVTDMARMGVWGIERSVQVPGLFTLHSNSVPCRSIRIAGGSRRRPVPVDLPFIRRTLPGLEGRDVVILGGHGTPRRINHGPTWRELAGLELPGAVVFNVACYTGVTGAWYSRDFRRGVYKREGLPPAESFCLAMLRTGLIGYTAYTCPRPAGPELDTEVAALVASGATLGEARRRDYDKLVLGYLGAGAARLDLAPVRNGAALPRTREAMRDIMLEMGTGGVLFGDPALQPFLRHAGGEPIQVLWTPGANDSGELRLSCAAHNLFLHCSDPTAMFGRTMAMKLYTRIPLGRDRVRKVTVTSCRLAGDAIAHRLVWATERDRGWNFLQAKVLFARPPRPGAVEARLQVELAPGGGSI